MICPCRWPVIAGAMPEVKNGKSRVDRAKCIGCSVCVIGCPEHAIEMQPVSEEEWFHTPSSMNEWEERRLEYLAAQENSQASSAS